MRVLITVSNRDLQKSISLYFNKLNIEADTANDGVQALIKLLEKKFDYLIIEKNIVRLDAKEVLEELKKKDIKVFSIVVDEKSRISYLDLIDNEFDLVIPKPFDVKKIIMLVNEDYKDLSMLDLEYDPTTRTIKYKDLKVHLNIIEILILKRLIKNKEISSDDIKSILKEENIDLISTYIESINYKLSKIKYRYIIKPIEKGYELVIL